MLEPFTNAGNGAPAEPPALLQTEKARLLYANLPAAIAANLLLALILAGIQRPIIAPHLLLGWLSLLGLPLLGRGVLAIAWYRAKTEPTNHAQYWIQLFRISVIATGIAWGIGSVLLSPTGDIVHQTYVAFVLAGLCAGAMTSLAIDRISINGFLLTALLPMTVFLMTEGDKAAFGMGIMVALFLLFVAFSALQTESSLLENFHLRIRAVENEFRLRQILENSPIATRIADAETNQIMFANSGYATLLNATPDQVLSIDPSRLYARPDEFTEVTEKLRSGERTINQLTELRFPDKPEWVKWVLASYFQVEYQNRMAVLGWFYDITDRKQMEERTQDLAYHDPLTGLPNRALLLDRLHQAMAVAEREHKSLALLFIDLDRFKPVNDHYGHDIGDLLLKSVAERIQQTLRQSDSVARIGGDEFIVLLPLVTSEQDVTMVAENIRQALNHPFDINDYRLSIAASTGIALYPDHATNSQQLLKHADIAMYCAKSVGRDAVEVYRPEMARQKQEKR